MGAFNVTLKVELEDGEVFEVSTDQRDWYKWERSGNRVNDPAKSVEMTRFLAWHAATRTGKTTLPWKEFDKVLVNAEDRGESEEGEDPTNPTL